MNEIMRKALATLGEKLSEMDRVAFRERLRAGEDPQAVLDAMAACIERKWPNVTVDAGMIIGVMGGEQVAG